MRASTIAVSLLIGCAAASSHAALYDLSFKGSGFRPIFNGTPEGDDSIEGILRLNYEVRGVSPNMTVVGGAVSLSGHRFDYTEFETNFRGKISDGLLFIDSWKPTDSVVTTSLFMGIQFNTDPSYRLIGVSFRSPLNGVYYTGGETTYTLVPASVPEPETWAMLVLGFAAAGAVMRRRTTFRAMRVAAKA